MFDDSILAAIRDHATAEYPNESCGIVRGRKGVTEYVPCTNIADDPRGGFMIAQAQVKQVRRGWRVLSIIHSHPDGYPAPSALDMMRQLQWDIPWGITASQASGSSAVLFFGAGAPKEPLMDRAFIHGHQDCKAFLDDWFRQERGIDLMDMPRDWEWWLQHGDNLYLKHLASAGFRAIATDRAGARATLRVGDCILFAVRSRVGPNHVGIYVGDGMFIHHPSARLPVSESHRPQKSVYPGSWESRATHWLRHAG